MAAHRRWRLLHITPHLGGGVGQAMVNLAQGDSLWPQGAPERAVLCLEPPQKTGAVERLRALGVTVGTLTQFDALPGIAASYDIVQCEVWNHPLVFGALRHLQQTATRMVFWCHVSGLDFPRLPQALWQQPFPVVLTAPCSLQIDDPGLKAARARGQVHVISSAAGFEQWSRPAMRPVSGNRCRLGYLGSLNLAKMHPDYVAWVAAANEPGLRIEVLGDEVHPGWLAERCRAWQQPKLLQLKGYCNDVRQALGQWDAMVYLLNPHHYGTAEIALLEAMASEVVPVVCSNPCEIDVVQHGDTGWVVSSPAELAQALGNCRHEPQRRARMGQRAAAWVRESFTTKRQALAFQGLYASLLEHPRLVIDWTALLGEQPWQWFRSTLPRPEAFTPGQAPVLPEGAARHAHMERSKGSVHHFARAYPDDAQLRAWSWALDTVADQSLARAA